MRVPQSFNELALYDENSPQWTAKSESLPPFWVLANNRSLGPAEREEEMAKWLDRFTEYYLEAKRPITRVQRLNTKLYKGIHYMSQQTFDSLPYNRNRRYDKNQAKLTINKIQLLTNQHVADAISYAPTVRISPTNNEEKDKVGARNCQGCLDHFDYQYAMEQKWMKFHLRKKLHGEAYMFVLWNPDIGDIAPQYAKLLQMMQEIGQEKPQIPLVDPVTGAPLKTASGDDIFVDRAVRVGDVECKLVYAENVLYPFPESGEWEDVKECEILEWMPLDEAKARWPHKANEIEKSQRDNYYTYAEYYPRAHNSISPKILVRHYFHRPTEFFDRGADVVSVEGTILDYQDYKYKHGQVPCVRDTDLDVPGEVWGMSFIQNLVPIQFAINNQASMFLQDQITMTYPKIVAPRGARVRMAKLGDDREIYEYSGPKPPEVMSKDPTPPQSWQYYQLMSDELKTLSAVFGASVGDPPNGITANVALRMLDEQETKLRGPAIKKAEQVYVGAARMILSVMGSYYEPDDGRLARILGANDSYTITQFDTTNLSSSYEVIVQKISGLPKSPAAKIQTVLDMAQQFPDLWSSDEVLEYLDIGRPEKLIESATIARQAAEAEVEAILQGKFDMVLPPAMSDDILPKYKVYAKAVQPMSFKLGTPPERQQAMMAQILTAEYIIWRKMQANPTFGQIVATEHPNFPMFFPLPTPDPNQMVLNLPSVAMAQMQQAAMGVNAPPLGGVPPEAAGTGVAGPPPIPQPPPQAGPPPQAQPTPESALP